MIPVASGDHQHASIAKLDHVGLHRSSRPADRTFLCRASTFCPHRRNKCRCRRNGFPFDILCAGHRHSSPARSQPRDASLFKTVVARLGTDGKSARQTFALVMRDWRRKTSNPESCSSSKRKQTNRANRQFVFFQPAQGDRHHIHLAGVLCQHTLLAPRLALSADVQAVILARRSRTSRPRIRNSQIAAFHRPGDDRAFPCCVGRFRGDIHIFHKFCGAWGAAEFGEQQSSVWAARTRTSSTSSSSQFFQRILRTRHPGIAAKSAA